MQFASTIVALGCCCVLGMGTVASSAKGQASGTPCPTGTTNLSVPDTPCATAPGVTKRFPYPGEGTSAASPASATQPDAPVPAVSPSSRASPTPDAPITPGPTVSAPAGRRFPYPGEASEVGRAAAAAGTDASGTKAPFSNGGDPGGLKDAGSSGESSSSSSSPSNSSSGSSDSSSSAASGGTPAGDGDAGSPFTDPDGDGTPTPKRARKKLPVVPRQSPSEREEEDVRIAGFYQNTGNFKAAYDRAQDAVSLSSDDAEAHLALAEAARRLGKLDEAQQHYRKCLDLDPVPKTRRVAEKALKEMSGGA